MFRFCALCSLLIACGDDDSMMMPPPMVVPGVPDLNHGPSVDGDIDGDGVPDDMDNCPSLANADQREACTYPPRPRPMGEDGPDAAARISWYRALVGLPPVAHDPMMTAGCADHVNYMIELEAETGMPDVPNEQDTSKPYSTPAGDMAARGSQLSFGRTDILAAIDASMNSPYARTTLLNPGLMRIGAAFSMAYGCIYTSAGLGAGTVEWPIYWPPADVVGTQRVFEGFQVPCPTHADPLGIEPMDCPPSAAIPSVGLYNAGAISSVTATLTNLDSGMPVPLFATLFDGGPTEPEMMGYLNDSIAAVPDGATTPELERALYEARVDAMVGDTMQTYRWRFRTARQLDAVGCDDRGEHWTIPTADPINPGETIIGRICEFGDMYFIAGEGARTITVELSHADGDLNLVAWGPPVPPSMMAVEIGRSAGPNDVEELSFDAATVEAGVHVQVYGEAMAMGIYAITSN